MSELLWKKLNSQDFVAGLGALTGNQAVQEVDAGLKRFIFLVGKLPQMRIFEKCILTNRFIRELVPAVVKKSIIRFESRPNSVCKWRW